MGDSAIEVTSLQKTYGTEVTLNDVSFSIAPGTVYGFLGPNGAGKTTTMRLLAGLTQPTSGTVRICNAPVDDRQSIATQVGYLPETPPLYEAFSAREQLEYVADLREMSADVASNRIKRYLDQFSLTKDANKPHPFVL